MPHTHRRTLTYILMSGLICIFWTGHAANTQPESGRSSLYPVTWEPGFTDDAGRSLPDFSYAGYRYGASAPPDNPGRLYVDVTAPPYNADNSGDTNTTVAIRDAINYVGENGGGVVYFPPGTYKISPSNGQFNNGDPYHRRAALPVPYSNVVLRGAGTDQTFLYNDETLMTGKRVISFAPRPEITSWGNLPETNPVLLREDTATTTKVIPVTDVSTFQGGEWILIRSDLTDAFLAEHQMTGYWDDAPGLLYLRRITGINPQAQTITIDIPVRYPLKVRDNARVYAYQAPMIRKFWC